MASNKGIYKKRKQPEVSAGPSREAFICLSEEENAQQITTEDIDLICKEKASEFINSSPPTPASDIEEELPPVIVKRQKTCPIAMRTETSSISTLLINLETIPLRSYKKAYHKCQSTMKTLEKEVLSSEGYSHATLKVGKHFTNEDLDDILARVELVNRQNRLVHDTLPVRNILDACRVANGMYRRYKLRNTPTAYRHTGTVICGYHPANPSGKPGPHIHIVHDCRWANSSCRCHPLSDITRTSNWKRRTTNLADLQAEDIRHVTEYVLLRPNHPIFVKVGNKYWYPNCEVGTISSGNVLGLNPQEWWKLSTCRAFVMTEEKGEINLLAQELREAIWQKLEAAPDRRGRRGHVCPEKVISFLKTYPRCPPEASFKSSY